MKITVIKKATTAKPMMACPIIIDDSLTGQAIGQTSPRFVTEIQI